MLRSMYSGISGLKNFQTKLDVIGNNISNVNTHGFKKGRVIFKDLISQTQSGATGPTLSVGGVNAKQVGLGTTLAAIDTVHGTGSMQYTGRTLDVAIQGEGFFMVAESEGTDATTKAEFSNVKYTRAGNFYMDKNGYLVNGDGYYLVGASAADGNPSAANDAYPAYPDLQAGDTYNIYDPTNAGQSIMTIDPATGVVDLAIAGSSSGAAQPIHIPTTAQSMSIGEDGTVTFTDSEGVLRWAGQLVLAKFPNAGGLEKTGNNYYSETANSGTPLASIPSEEGIGKSVSSTLEMSNVDLSEEFTEMIVAQRGFQANSRIITTSDEILQELVNLKR
ncbi:flagellar basal body rod protein FlgG [Lysinibacillus sp. KU-BSD001]|uniref:flagellar basal body rod protein FlgG n=1 Tax=Lysinibacillus sp. KU-BSD001 TaxID=3141328 RepID=UPI0036EB4BF2